MCSWTEKTAQSIGECSTRFQPGRSALSFFPFRLACWFALTDSDAWGTPALSCDSGIGFRNADLAAGRAVQRGVWDSDTDLYSLRGRRHGWHGPRLRPG